MRITNMIVLAGVLAAVVSPSRASDDADSAQACWKPAFEAADAEAVAKCYADDAVLWLPGTPMMKGRDAIREGYVGFFSAYTVKDVSLVPLGHSRHGDEVASWGSFSMVMVAREGGKETPSMGRYTDVSRKIDGRWVYVVDHASEDPAPAPASAAR